MPDAPMAGTQKTRLTNMNSTEVSGTKLEIVESAEEILRSSGFPHFTLRRIAEHSGVTLSNLQYYFHSKEELLSTVIRHGVQRFAASIDAVMQDSELSAMDKLLASAEIRFNAAFDPETRKFMTAMIDLASHNSSARQSLNDLQTGACDGFAELIRDIDPGLSRSESMRKAVLVHTLLEGFFTNANLQDASKRKISQVKKDTLSLIENFMA